MPDYLDNDKDNDGLPDFYERNVTHTDPANNDSDAPSTSYDEAGNDVIDGMEDFDNDTLGAYREYTLGTDPFEADTDGDGLSDGFEVRHNLDPLDSDTDDDGTPDGEEDPDGDGLTNRNESTHGTAIRLADTDDDGIDDGAEVDAGTDPLATDSDNDGLTDAEERGLDTDPTDPDTDGDGTLDGNETYTTIAKNESLGVSVALNGQGNISDDVTVQREKEPILTTGAVQNASVGPIVDFESQTDFENATLSFEYNDGDVTGDEFNLTIFRYNDSSQTYIPLNTTVDRYNNTLQTEVTHFSTYAALDAQKWYSRFSRTEENIWSYRDTFADGQAEGWRRTAGNGTLAVRDGSLVVSHSESTFNPEIIVAKNGSGDFESIQPAVNAATNGETVLVKSGIYREQVIVNSSITLLGHNATLDGSDIDGYYPTVIKVRRSSPNIRGFEITNSSIGVQIAGEANLSRMTIRNMSHDGIDADRSNVLLSNISFRNIGGDGIQVSYESGYGSYWNISNISMQDIDGTGIDAHPGGAGHKWSISNAVLKNVTEGIIFDSFHSKLDISNTSVKHFEGKDGWWGHRKGVGIAIHFQDGSVNLSKVSLTNGEIGIHSKSDFVSSQTDDLAHIINTSISDVDTGIQTADSSQTWKLAHTEIRNTTQNAISDHGSDNHWNLANLSLRNATTGVYVENASGPWEIHWTDFIGIDNIINIENSTDTIQASNNWWGQPSGPTADQIVGPVNTANPCSEPCAFPGENTSVSTPSADALRSDILTAIHQKNDSLIPGEGGNTTNGSIGDGVTRVARAVETPAPRVTRNVTIEVSARAEFPTNDSHASISIQTPSGTVLDSTEIGEFTDIYRFQIYNVFTPEVRIVVESHDGATIFLDHAKAILDSDDDGLPDSIEQGFETGFGREIQTDPYDSDTDGDGITDGQEVGPSVLDTRRTKVAPETWETIQISYRKLSSNPTQVDSDGDGLTDPEERNGWETAIASSRAQANTYAEERNEHPFSAENVLDQETVTSDPLLEDSDGDGVDDLAEQINRLDPRSSDSDGDKLSDHTELRLRDQSDEYAPAIYENTPPSVTVRSIVAVNGRTEYDVVLQASDASGLGAIDLLKKGEVQNRTWGHGRTTVSREVSFYVDRDLIEVIQVGAGSFFTSAVVEVEAHDQLWNNRKQKFYGADGFAQIADAAADAPLSGGVGRREAIQLMGFSSGVKTSGKQAVTDIYNLARHPVESGEQMAAVAGYIAKNASVLAELPGMMADQVASKQDRINPFVEGSEESTFADSWYLGYVTGSGISMAVGDKGTSAVVGRLSQSSTRIGRAMRAMKAARASVKAGISSKTMALAGRVNGRLPDVDLDTGQIANRLSEVSQPARLRTTRQLREMDSDTWKWINDNGVVYRSASKATRIVRATGKTGREALESLGKDGRAALLRLSDDVTTTRSILKAWQGGDISTREMGTLLRHLNEVSGDEAKIADDIIDSSGDGGIELLAKGKVCNSPCDRVDEVLDDIDADLSSVDQEDVTEVGTKLSRAVEDDEISVAEANDLLGDIERLAKDGEDVTDLFTDSDTVVTNRLIRRHAEGDLDRSHLKRIDELVESGTMDQADVRRLTEMLDQRGSDPLIDDSIEADDLLEVAKDGTLKETQLVVTDASGATRWLEDGHFESGAGPANDGWEYLESRHIEGKSLEQKDATDFWPLGQQIKSEELPDTMTEKDVRKAVYEAVEKTDTTSEGKFLYDGYDTGFVDRTGVSEVQVVMRDGRIRTAWPKKGSSVWKYVSEGDHGWIK